MADQPEKFKPTLQTSTECAALLLDELGQATNRDIAGQMNRYFESCATVKTPEIIRGQAESLLRQIHVTRQAAYAAAVLICKTYDPQGLFTDLSEGNPNAGT